MNFGEYLTQVHERYNELKSKGLELYTIGNQRRDGNLYLIALKSKELIDGKIILNDQDKETLKQGIPEIFDADYILNQKNKTRLFKTSDEELNNEKKSIERTVEERYEYISENITQYTKPESLDRPLTEESFKELLKGKGIKIYYDSFHTH